MLAVAAPNAWSQTVLTPGHSVTLANGTVDVFGFGVTISNCTSCGGDSLELLSSATGTIDLEVVNTANPGTSAILSTTSTATLTYTLAFAPLAGSNATVTAVTQTATGQDNCSGSQSGHKACSGTASAMFAGLATGVAATPATLTDTLTPTTGTGTVTVSPTPMSSTTFMQGGPMGTAVGVNTFTVGETLSLSHNMQTVSDLAFDALTLKLNTAPEPASIAIFFVGLGGVAIARRRRRRGGR